MALEDQAATGEIIPDTEVNSEIVEPISMDDTIRNTLRGLQEKGITPDTSEATPESPEEKAQAIRDEKGKFSAGTSGASLAENLPLSSRIACAFSSRDSGVASEVSGVMPFSCSPRKVLRIVSSIEMDSTTSELTSVSGMISPVAA